METITSIREIKFIRHNISFQYIASSFCLDSTIQKEHVGLIEMPQRNAIDATTEQSTVI